MLKSLEVEYVKNNKYERLQGSQENNNSLQFMYSLEVKWAQLVFFQELHDF